MVLLRAPFSQPPDTPAGPNGCETTDRGNPKHIHGRRRLPGAAGVVAPAPNRLEMRVPCHGHMLTHLGVPAPAVATSQAHVHAATRTCGGLRTARCHVIAARRPSMKSAACFRSRRCPRSTRFDRHAPLTRLGRMANHHGLGRGSGHGLVRGSRSHAAQHTLRDQGLVAAAEHGRRLRVRCSSPRMAVCHGAPLAGHRIC